MGAFITFMIIGVYNDSLAFKDAERWIKLLGQSLLLDVDIIGFNWVLNFLAQALSLLRESEGLENMTEQCLINTKDGVEKFNPFPNNCYP